MVNIGNSWDKVLEESFKSTWYAELRAFLVREYKTFTVYPDMFDIFNALKATPFEDVKVVILGQDPYHNPGEAHGMCFSVTPKTRIPASLMNIYKELQADIGAYIPDNGYLKSWADAGVLLLNTILTVRADQPLSHKGKGWEHLCDDILKALNGALHPVVFLFWGASARAKRALITNPNHLVLESAHPSPLAAQYGFLGCRHFSRTNKFLKENGREPIDWQIRNINTTASK
jgi:uracil-DNA glycosylase